MESSRIFEFFVLNFSVLDLYCNWKIYFKHQFSNKKHQTEATTDSQLNKTMKLLENMKLYGTVRKYFSVDSIRMILFTLHPQLHNDTWVLSTTGMKLGEN